MHCCTTNRCGIVGIGLAAARRVCGGGDVYGYAHGLSLACYASPVVVVEECLGEVTSWMGRACARSQHQRRTLKHMWAWHKGP